MKRILSVSLAVVLIALTLPVFAAGNGTEGNPYEISTAEELAGIKNNMSAHYLLVNDIDLLEYGNWTPIGGKFTGVLDGAGHSIDGMTIAVYGDYKDTGLFERLGACTVKNLSLTEVDISASGDWLFVGGIAGIAMDIDAGKTMTIENCAVSGTISVTGSGFLNCGGIVGGMRNGDFVVDNCTNSAEISAVSEGGANTGGITGSVGVGTLKITNCGNDGNVTASGASAYAGGIVGGMDLYGSVEITGCFSTGAVSAATAGNTYVGGIAGRIDCNAESTLVIDTCITAGDIRATGASIVYAGGIAGYIRTTQEGALIENCVSLCNATAVATLTSQEYSVAGGICGQVQGTAEISGCVAAGGKLIAKVTVRIARGNDVVYSENLAIDTMVIGVSEDVAAVPALHLGANQLNGQTATAAEINAVHGKYALAKPVILRGKSLHSGMKAFETGEGMCDIVIDAPNGEVMFLLAFYDAQGKLTGVFKGEADGDESVMADMPIAAFDSDYKLLLWYANQQPF